MPYGPEEMYLFVHDIAVNAALLTLWKICCHRPV